MTTGPEVRAEVRKLARLLGVEHDRIGFLERCSAAELREYREQVVELLFDDGSDLLRRAAEAARILPVGVSATISQRALGPVLCARLAGFVAPSTAVAVAERLSDEDLGRVAAELDPRRAAEVVAAMPVDRVRDIARAMAAADEHVGMGRFVAHLSPAALAACVEVIADDDLLRIGFVLEGQERLDEVVGCLDDERVARLAARARDEELDEELEEVVRHLGPKQRERVLAAAG